MFTDRPATRPSVLRSPVKELTSKIEEVFEDENENEEVIEVEKEMEEDTHTELSRSTSAPAMSPLPRDCKYNLIQSDISLNVQCGFLGRVIPKMQAC